MSFFCARRLPCEALPEPARNKQNQGDATDRRKKTDDKSYGDRQMKKQKKGHHRQTKCRYQKKKRSDQFEVKYAKSGRLEHRRKVQKPAAEITDHLVVI